MKGLKDNKAAAQEAFEEAGVVGHIGKIPVGRYVYQKHQIDGFDLCEVAVYLLKVDRQLKTWPEANQRVTAWFSVEDAAARVGEPDLSGIIRDLCRDPLQRM